MEPQDSTQLGVGTIYVGTSEGLRHLGKIDEWDEATEGDPKWPKETPYIKPTNDATYTAETQISPDVARAFKALGATAAKMTETFEIVWSLCKRVVELYERYPNKRVKHLALYAKKQRTRKKNMRRIGREMMKEAKKRNDRTRPSARRDQAAPEQLPRSTNRAHPAGRGAAKAGGSHGVPVLSQHGRDASEWIRAQQPHRARRHQAHGAGGSLQGADPTDDRGTGSHRGYDRRPGTHGAQARTVPLYRRTDVGGRLREDGLQLATDPPHPRQNARQARDQSA